jgi:protein-S-isoprenylcysteine O-methyltransferase Ste14
VIFRALAFVTAASGLALVAGPYLVLTAYPEARVMLGGLRWSGLVLMAAAAVIYLDCLVRFLATGGGTPAPYEPPRQLVRLSLYRRVRNPMYLAVLLALTGEAVLFESPALIAYAAGVGFMFHLWVVLYEEPSLARRFGAAYEAYRWQVPRWIPRLGPLPDFADRAEDGLR